MKEITSEDWVKNPTPREMWVWDDDINRKAKRKVVYINDNDKSQSPVIAITSIGTGSAEFKHCAEIEEPKTRLMTNQEFAWWLQDGIREGKHREYKYNYSSSSSVHFEHIYPEEDADKPVNSWYVIRENNCEWHEPLMEVEE